MNNSTIPFEVEVGLFVLIFFASIVTVSMVICLVAYYFNEMKPIKVQRMSSLSSTTL